MSKSLKKIPLTIFFTYTIMLISLFNSVIMVNFYGLSLRGELAFFILLPSIVAGSAAAFFEERYALNSMLRKYHTLILLFFMGIFLFLLIFSESSLEDLIIMYILVHIEYMVAVLLIVFLKYDLFLYNSIRLMHPSLFMLMNFYSSVIPNTSANPLLLNYILSNFVVLLVAGVASYWKKFKIFNKEGNDSKNALMGSFYITRPITSSMDKVLFSSLLTSDSFGAYVTISNIFSLSGPLLNTMLQFSFFNHIKTISGRVLNTIWAICAIIVISILPLVDAILYNNQLDGHWKLLYFIGLFSIINLNLKQLENKVIKISSNNYLPILKASILIIALIMVNWDAKVTSIFLIITVTIYLYKLSNASKELQAR